MGRNRDGKRQDENQLEEDWGDEISFNDDYSDLKEVMLDMMSELAEMWDGRLGKVMKVKKSIETDTEDAEPIRSATYRAGLKNSNWRKTTSTSWCR